jgi:hypothetical protein
MFMVVAVAPPIGEPSLYHWFPAPALLVNTIFAVPAHATTGPTGPIVGVAGIGVTVTTLVPVNKVVHVVVGFVARTVIVVLEVSAVVIRLIDPPVPATALLSEVAPLNNS